MKLDLKEWINKILSRIVYYDRPREVLTGNTSSYGSATGSYNSGTLMTLKPNTRYLLLGTGHSSSGNAIQYFSGFKISSGSGQKKFFTIDNQPYATSGGRHPFAGYIETGSTSIGIGITCYKYATGLTYYWNVYAIEL